MIRDIGSCIQLNNGVEMPVLGLGLFRVRETEMEQAVRWAVEIGYRSFDTAAFYENEEAVGKSIANCRLPRERLFVSTKIWPTDYDRPEQAIEDSLRRLHMEYVDLLLMHWPGTDEDRRLRVWETMQNLMQKGRVRACGVSNFSVRHLEQLEKRTGAVPSNHQIEMHPWRQQREVRRYCEEHRISVTAWGPLFHGHLREAPLMEEIGAAHGKTAAQATLRWHIQRGVAAIPKSVRKSRLMENADIFDFTLTEEEMRRIDDLDGKGKTFAHDADTFDGGQDCLQNP